MTKHFAFMLLKPLALVHSSYKFRTVHKFVHNMAATIPNLKFNNGIEVPIFGLGTWKSPPGEVKAAVEAAIDVGYRHIDCAHLYGNEKEVGAALKTKIDAGVVKRSELFITSKLWCNFLRPDLVPVSLNQSLSDLGLQYLDLYLIHWPTAFKEEQGLFPKGADGKILFSDVDYVDTWKAMEGLVTSGLVRSVGVSNFNAAQLKRVLDSCTIRPVTNQIECHPYLNQTRLSKVCKDNGILVTAYSPLGSPDRPWAKPEDPQLLEDPKIKSLAKKYNKTPAQIVIRYQIDKGHIVIPKSVTASRIAQNMDVFGFKLSTEDLKLIDSFDCNGRVCTMVEGAGHKHHPFENDEY